VRDRCALRSFTARRRATYTYREERTRKTVYTIAMFNIYPNQVRERLCRHSRGTRGGRAGVHGQGVRAARRLGLAGYSRFCA